MVIRIDLGGVNCYLLKGKDGFILADTGGHLIMDKTFADRRETLVTKLKEAGVKPGNLRLIFLTHGDCDHIGNAAYLRDAYQTKIAMHPADVHLAENPGLEDYIGSFQFKSVIYKIVLALMKRTIRAVSAKILAEFERFRPDILFDDDFRLSDYGVDGEVLHLPGHTEGSVGILTAQGDLIAGDTLANTKKPSPAGNALDFRQLSGSVKQLQKLPIKTVYPGHGEPFEKDRM